MSDTKMLQKLLDGQSELKKGQTEIKEELKKVNTRLDVIGKSVAYLEDDTPTREEHDKLEKRVKKIEKDIHPAN